MSLIKVQPHHAALLRRTADASIGVPSVERSVTFPIDNYKVPLKVVVAQVAGTESDLKIAVPRGYSLNQRVQDEESDTGRKNLDRRSYHLDIPTDYWNRIFWIRRKLSWARLDAGTESGRSLFYALPGVRERDLFDVVNESTHTPVATVEIGLSKPESDDPHLTVSVANVSPEVQVRERTRSNE